jgi:hypothetical protein
MHDLHLMLTASADMAAASRSSKVALLKQAALHALIK